MSAEVGTRAPQTPQANPALLHKFLGIGLVVTGAVLIVVKQFTAGEDTRDTTQLFEYVFSAISAVMAGLALLLLKPQVPGRRAGQTPAQYWSDVQATGAALRFWFILEGAGIIAAVGHFLSGGPISATIWALVATAFWLNGPRAFEMD